MKHLARTVRDIEVDHPVTIRGADGQAFTVDLDPDRPDFATTDGVLVWMHDVRPSGKVYLDTDGRQVGPVHRDVYSAISWARYVGWIDPSAPSWWNESCLADVRASVTLRGTTRRWWPTLEQLEQLTGDDRFWLRPEATS